jgi:hypothetical protein
VASGVSYTFNAILKSLQKLTGRAPVVDSRARTKPKVDNAFDNTLLKQVCPGFAFTPLEEGLRKLIHFTGEGLSFEAHK